MRGTSIFIIFALIAEFANAQEGYYLLNFEDELTTQHHLTIDSISNPNNSWRIGKPNKTYFTEAFSLPNVIVTDTINSYPTNDSSVFIFTHYVSSGYVQGHTADMYGWYRVDSDSLKDFGRIEFSPDNGKLWIDLINDTIHAPIWGSPKPVLTGISDWTLFHVILAHMGFEYELGDTVLFRFTFISDEVDNHRDGLMFDDLAFSDIVEGMKLLERSEFNSTIFPNPGNQMVTIEFENYNILPVLLEIFDYTGKLIFRGSGGEQGYFRVDVSAFKSGGYFYRLVDHISKKLSHGKFIVK
ncbi:MAG: T9SS type A sorting domain-containing protein [Bacteroidales bacterium]